MKYVPYKSGHHFGTFAADDFRKDDKLLLLPQCFQCHWFNDYTFKYNFLMLAQKKSNLGGADLKNMGKL